MDARALKNLVDDYPSWRGNAYTLAANVAAAEREALLTALIELGHAELAETLRAQP